MPRRPVRRNPRYHRNADEPMRRLERAAAAGDPAALAELFIARMRAGTPVVVAASEVLRNASVRDLQRALPPSVTAELLDNVATARHTRLNRPGPDGSGGWFPDHVPQNVCPRGHPVEERGFDYTEVGMSWDRVYEATPRTLVTQGDRENADEPDAEWVSCRKCYASWPSGPTVHDLEDAE